MAGGPLTILLAGLKIVASPAIKLASNIFGRNAKLADAELAELRAEIKALRDLVSKSSVQAQMAVRGSPNEPAAQEALREAVRLATEAGQALASLVDPEAIAHGLPAWLLQSRIHYREVVTDELNLDATQPEERELRCAAIEQSCGEFNRQISKYVYARWGIGTGAFSGRKRGRNLPD